MLGLLVSLVLAIQRQAVSIRVDGTDERVLSEGDVELVCALDRRK